MSEAKKASSKGLLGLLIITVLITLWTAFNDGSDEGADITLVQPVRAKVNAVKQAEVATKSEPVEINTSVVNSEKTNSTLPSHQEKISFPWQALKRESAINHIQDIFVARSWLVVLPPPPPPPAEPAPPPQAPPAPFEYVGKMENTPNTGKVFLIQNNQFYYVAKGENINKEWRLDKEEANLLRLTYLPLNLPQVLTKSAKRPAPQAAPEAAFEPN